MKKGTRRGLFYGLIALFIVVGTAIVLYAQGWRLDLTTGQVTKIGAIYVRSHPADATISLNGKSAQNTSGFLSPGTLISDLFPKTYTLGLTEPGYQTWQERVSVFPSLVTTLKYAVLIPKNATPVASGTTQDFFATQGVIANESSVGAISIFGNVVARGTLASGTTDGRVFLFKDKSGDYHFYDARSSTTKDISIALANDGIPMSAINNIELDPRDGSQAIITGQKKIWMLDLGTLALTLIETTPATETLSPSVAINSSLIAWTRFAQASNTSALFLYDRSAGNLQETSTTITGATEKLSWISGGKLGILQNDGSLSIYDSNTDQLQKLADDVADFSASSDGTMVAALEHSSTEIFNLDDPAGYYRFNLPDVHEIKNLIWYKDDTHLFVVYPDHVSFLDLQDLGLSNFETVVQGTSPSYDQSSNSLYFISPTSQLMQLVFPT